MCIPCLIELGQAMCKDVSAHTYDDPRARLTLQESMWVYNKIISLLVNTDLVMCSIIGPGA
jgi:hypothetical protein